MFDLLKFDIKLTRQNIFSWQCNFKLEISCIQVIYWLCIHKNQIDRIFYHLKDDDRSLVLPGKLTLMFVELYWVGSEIRNYRKYCTLPYDVYVTYKYRKSVYNFSSVSHWSFVRDAEQVSKRTRNLRSCRPEWKRTKRCEK